MLTLFEALVPRQSVFDRAQTDTVWSLSDLGQLDAERFFAENYLTEAMRVLLPEAFKRLEQRQDSSAGIYLLSQSMGGGKTHSLIALGLLAANQGIRPRVLGECGYTPGPLGKVRVVAFNGGSVPTPNGIWGYIAEAVGKPEKLKGCYAPMRAPAVAEWQGLLEGDPTLILLDELPPYFSEIRGTPTGATTLDEITTVALRNLFTAIQTNKLPNVCLVLTDLAGTAYQSSAGALASLTDAKNEANRVAVTLCPVNLATDELYHILRKRVFEAIPDEDRRAEVADSYLAAIEMMQKAGLLSDVSSTLRQQFVEAYPFHPSIRDIYARVKENASFQQTRAIIRIARIMVRRLWDSGLARQRYLVAAYDFDSVDQAMRSEIAQINGTFEAAVAKDIESTGGTATAQKIDAGVGTDAQDAAKLLFLSSLSTAVNPTLGLHRTELFEALAAPGRDPAIAREALDRLQERAWYVHVMAGSKLVFRNTENLVAKVEAYVRNTNADMREQELRKRLADLFKPSTRDVYEEVYALAPLDQVVLEADRVKLVIYRPTAESRQAVLEFFEQQIYKNRACYLTAESEQYLTALERAAYLAALDRITGEPAFTALHPNDPQRKQADDLNSQYKSRFFQAVSSGFCRLTYPWPKGTGLYETELTGAVGTETREGVTTYVARGESAIRKVLVEMGKYVAEQTVEALLPKVDRIWPDSQKSIEWNELKRLSAVTAGYAWHHPKSLDWLRDEMAKRDEWRANNGWVERGPFAKPPATVEVERKATDKETGRATIRVRPVPANAVVHYCVGVAATDASPRLEKLEFETGDLMHSFLCRDPSGKYPAGDAVTFTLSPTVKYGFPTVDGARRVSLVALPGGTVRYTVDGSSVEASGIVYSGPFEAPPGALVLARAEGAGVTGEVISFRVPEAGRKWVLDPKRPAVWRHPHECDSTNETYRFLGIAKAFDARLGGLVRLTAAKDGRTTELNTFEGAYEPAQFQSAIETLRQFVPDANLTLSVERLDFGSGADLEGLANELPVAISEGEVDQPT